MRKNYNKLVRDRIPEIIRASNRQCFVEIMPEDKYRQSLLDKLVEEAQEIQQTEPNELINELADLFEVIDSVIDAWDISREAVLQVQCQRRAERGGFEQRLRLLWTEDGDQDS